MSTETYVNSSAIHLIEADKYPVKTLMLSALIRGEDFLSAKLKSVLGGISKTIPTVFNYAKNDYTLGLPTGKTTQLNAPTKNNMATIIADVITYPLGVVVTKFKYDFYEPYFDVLDYLSTERDLDFDAKVIKKYSDLNFSNLQQMKIVGSAISTDNLSVTMSYEYWAFVIHTIEGDENNPRRSWPVWEKISEHSDIIDRPNTTNITYGDKCLIAWYSKLDALGEMLPGTYTWLYRLNSDVYPTLDDSNFAAVSDEYFPIVPVRYKNQDLTGQDAAILQKQLDDTAILITAAQAAYDAAYALDLGVEIVGDGGTTKPPSWSLYQDLFALQVFQNITTANLADATAVPLTDLYDTSKRLLNLLHIPFLKLGDKLNENPSIKDIDHAYVVFGADVQTTNTATLAYLNHYFNYLGESGATVYRSDTYETAAPYSWFNSALTEHGLTLSLEFESISISFIVGKIDRGHLGNARKIIECTRYPDTRGYNDELGPTGSAAYVDTKLILDLQFTANTIRRVTVENLTVRNFIAGETAVVTTLDMLEDDPNNHNLIIPLEYNLSLELPLYQRNAVYSDCILLIINSVLVQKLKWYEEEWFTPVMALVIFIIICYTGQVWLVGLLAAESVVIYLLVTAIVSIVSDLVMDWVVTKIGTKIGIIGAIVLTVIALVLSQGKSGFQFTVFATQFTIMFAQLALQIASALISSLNEFIKIGTQKIIDSYTTFSKYLDDILTKQLDNPEVEALSLKNVIDPMLIINQPKKYYSVPNEYPDNFYRRTLGLTYNSFYGIHGAVSNFVTDKLTLPLRA